MKNAILIIFFLCCTTVSAQTAKATLGLNGGAVIPMGDNYLKDGVKNFGGVGLTFQTIFKYNMGFGIELSRFFSEVKNPSIYGELSSPRLTNLSAYFIYQYPVSDAFKVEGQVGLGIMALTSQSEYNSEGYTENAAAFFLGTEFSYKFQNSKVVEIYASPKIYFFDSLVKFEDRKLDRYYSRAGLLNINVGVRLNLN